MEKIILCLIASALSYTASANELNHRGSTGGRFQVIQISDFRTDQFLLDTQTGKLWSRGCSEGNCVWQREPVEGIDPKSTITATIKRADQISQQKNEAPKANWKDTAVQVDN